jgi:hypothetical protein
VKKWLLRIKGCHKYRVWGNYRYIQVSFVKDEFCVFQSVIVEINITLLTFTLKIHFYKKFTDAELH